MFPQPAGSCPTYSTIHTLLPRWTLLIWDRALSRLQQAAWSDIRPVGSCAGIFTIATFPRRSLSWLHRNLGPCWQIKVLKSDLKNKWKTREMNPLLCSLIFHLHTHTPAVSKCPVSELSCDRIFKKLSHSNGSKSISSSFSSSQSWIVAPLPSLVICFLLFTTSDMAFDYAFVFGNELVIFSCRGHWTGEMDSHFQGFWSLSIVADSIDPSE